MPEPPKLAHDAAADLYNDTNVIVMSEAGKPIFARYGSSEEIARQCGLIQAIRTATNGNSALELGEIQSLSSSRVCMLFMTVGSITLISISKRSSKDAPGLVYTEAFGRLQLEYIYAQLIFNFTDHVQQIFQHNPGYDLRSMMASGDNVLHGLLDATAPDGNAGPFFVGGIQPISPISHKLRKKTSLILQSVGNKTENVAFALMIVEDKLLSLVQPSYRPHQLRVSDLHLIVNFVNKQQGLLTSELWIPMCLPRFNSSGFLYAYTNCLHVESKLSLILISSHNTTEEFQILRSTAIQIRDEMGLPDSSENIVAVDASQNPSSSSLSQSNTESESFDEDYVTIPSNVVDSSPSDSILLREIQLAKTQSNFEHMKRQYLSDSNNGSSSGRKGSTDDEDSSLLLHFLFRVDVQVKSNARQQVGGKGRLTQCISPSPIPFPFETTASRRRLWAYYQQLSLRLRLGSATPESSHDAFDMIVHDDKAKTEATEGVFPVITSNCPAMGLYESPPNVHGVTYVIDQSEIFLAMNGRDFELYMVASNIIPVKRAAAIGTKLVRRLMADEKRLFLSSPLTWRE